jgi:hypothetical protein
MVEPQTQWMICFVDTPPDRPWIWLTRKYFRHVFAMTYIVREDRWMFVEWAAKRLHIHLLTGEETDAVFAAVREQGIMVDMPVTPDPKPTLWAITPVYCVSYLRQLIGLPGPIFTPYQLFRALCRQGGRIIFDARNQQSETQP